MRAFLLGAALLAMSACAGNDDNKDPGLPPGPDPTDPTDPPTPEETSRDYDELANVIGAHVRGEFAIMLAAAQISESQFPAGFTATGVNAEGRTTGEGVRDGMSFAFAFHCTDGSAAQTVVPCDGAAHHSHITLAMNGSLAVGSLAMDQVAREVDWEIRDLTLDKARFRGPDQASLSTSITTEGVAATYTVNFGATYEQVRFMPNAVIPTFGTIDFTLNAERVRAGDRRVFNATAQLVYGASGVPTTLTIDGVLNYSINLTTGAVAKL